MFFPVMHVVLKGPVTVVTVVSPPHGAGYVLQQARGHLLNSIVETGLSSSVMFALKDHA